MYSENIHDIEKEFDKMRHLCYSVYSFMNI